MIHHRLEVLKAGAVVYFDEGKAFGITARPDPTGNRHAHEGLLRRQCLPDLDAHAGTVEESGVGNKREMGHRPR